MKKLFRSAILGAPASGKGTVSSNITNTFEIVHISTGDIMRQTIADKTPLGKEIHKYISEGALVPDNLVLEMIFDRLKKISTKNWLCDGFPRTVMQAEEIHKVYPFNLVINLDVPNDVIVKRIQGRWIHLPSGRSYHTEFKPPKNPGYDDLTGDRLVQRLDDNAETVKNRIRAYEKEKGPVLEFYKNKGILQEFKGGIGIDVWPPIRKTLEKYLPPKF